jgi:disulfide bond formation protein DsbB
VNVSNRVLFALGAAACAALLASGYYLQYVEGQEPCPLCLVQRGFYYGVGVVFAVGAVHGSATLVYPIGSLLLALGGFGVAARQVWLQHLPPEQVPACGPDLLFMLQNLPIARTIEKLFTGSGQCAEVKWRFLGLSIAEWSAAWFAALALLAAVALIRSSRRRASGASLRPQG